MKKFSTFFIFLFITFLVFTSKAYSQINPPTAQLTETPPKTLFVKHPAANDPATFFSTSTVYTFYIYKPGDMAKITSVFKKEAEVQSCNLGPLAGDYQQIDLSLKSARNKMWFIALFKKAGITMIKINTNPVVELEKM